MLTQLPQVPDMSLEWFAFQFGRAAQGGNAGKELRSALVSGAQGSAARLCLLQKSVLQGPTFADSAAADQNPEEAATAAGGQHTLHYLHACFVLTCSIGGLATLASSLHTYCSM